RCASAAGSGRGRRRRYSWPYPRSPGPSGRGPHGRTLPCGCGYDWSCWPPRKPLLHRYAVNSDFSGSITVVTDGKRVKGVAVSPPRFSPTSPTLLALRAKNQERPVSADRRQASDHLERLLRERSQEELLAR